MVQTVLQGFAQASVDVERCGTSRRLPHASRLRRHCLTHCYACYIIDLPPLSGLSLVSLCTTPACTADDVYHSPAQVPEATIWYGPDTYMGRNLAQLFSDLALLPDEEVRKDCDPLCTALYCPMLLPGRKIRKALRSRSLCHDSCAPVYRPALLLDKEYCSTERATFSPGVNLLPLGSTACTDVYCLQVRALHPDHTAASVAAFLPRLRYYENGTCIVHHIFGGEVRLAMLGTV